MKQGFVHLGYLCENSFIQSHFLLLLEPNIQKEFQKPLVQVILMCVYGGGVCEY